MYDLVDVDIHHERRSKNGGESKGTFTPQPRGNSKQYRGKGQTSEAKAAEQFLSSIDGLTFDPEHFARHISNAEPVLQSRILDIITAYIELWDDYYLAGALKGDLNNFGHLVHKISEALDEALCD